MFRESVVISVKENKVFSIQKEEHGRALRFLKFNESFFTDISGEKQGIKFQIGKMYNILNGDVKDDDIVNFKIRGNAIIVRHNGNTFRFGWSDPDEEVKTCLPFPIKNGIPVIGDSKIKLSTHFTTIVSDLKTISKYMNKFGTEFYKFSFKRGNVISRVGDLHDFSDYVEVNAGNDIIQGDLKRVIFTFGLSDIANTFEQDAVHMYTTDDSPIWIFEGNGEYQHGILLPPFIPEE